MTKRERLRAPGDRHHSIRKRDAIEVGAQRRDSTTRAIQERLMTDNLRKQLIIDELRKEDVRALTDDELNFPTGGFRITNIRGNASQFAGSSGSFQGQVPVSAS